MYVDNEQSPAFTLSVDSTLKVPKKRYKIYICKIKKKIIHAVF